MAFDGAAVYEVAGNFGRPSLTEVARQVGVITALRVTAYYPQQRLRHSVACVIEHQHAAPRLEMVYEGINRHRALRLRLARDDLERLLNVLRQTKFDRLADQANLSYMERSLWLIQRAAGTHCHSIIVAPDLPRLPYAAIVNAIDAWLPQAIREIPL